MPHLKNACHFLEIVIVVKSTIHCEKHPIFAQSRPLTHLCGSMKNHFPLTLSNRLDKLGGGVNEDFGLSEITHVTGHDTICPCLKRGFMEHGVLKI